MNILKNGGKIKRRASRRKRVRQTGLGGAALVFSDEPTLFRNPSPGITDNDSIIHLDP